MQTKSLINSLSKAALAPAALLLFLAIHPGLNAQTQLVVNVSPGSLSSDWGAVPSAGQYERQEVQQKSYHARSSAKQASHSKQVAYVGVDNPQIANFSQEPAERPTPELPGNAAMPTVPGNRAVLRWGVAYAPENAPLAVKKAIWAINSIRTKPYVWGGGHDSFFDPRGYDCSGTVSFALHYAGQLSSPTTSQDLMSFGEAGQGRWITVYARDGHTWMVIAGLRLDTTGYYGNEGPRWRQDGRSSWGFTARHPAGL